MYMLSKLKKLKVFLVISMIFSQLIFIATPTYAIPNDVKGYWAEKEINIFVEKGLAKGYPGGAFKPDKKINRAEFVTLVNKAFGFTNSQNIKFLDVEPNAWFYGELAKAHAVGYISGYNDGTFRPFNEITRQEVASILFKALNLTSAANNDIIHKMADYNNIATWSKNAVNAVLGKNIMKGYPDNTFKPNESITRAEAIVALYNATIGVNPANSEETSNTTTTTGGGGGGGDPLPAGITTKQALISAVSSGASTIAIDANINLDSTTLDINRAVTINGGNYTLTGNVSVNATGVTINNLTMTGDLVLSEGIGEGDASLNGVQVNGSTIVKGGGTNSIHFSDSVLATVIVNKNDGRVRVVLEGNTQVYEIQLDTPSIVNTVGLTGNEAGISNLIVSDSMQRSSGDVPEVELLGSFETISSRATNIRINLSSEASIDTLVLNAITQVLGGGAIITAEINADGSTISQRPQNVILDNGSSVIIGQETVTDSYSSSTSTNLTGITATQGSISLTMDQFVAGLTEGDFTVTASVYSNIDGEELSEEYVLQNLNFNSVHNRFTFSPISLTDNIGKQLVIKVEPAENSEKISGAAQTATVTIGTGFEGRITDTNYVGVKDAVIKFRAGSGTTEGEIVGQVYTDRFGYYSIALPAGVYTGEITGPNIIPTYLLANAPTDTYLVDQNETTFRSAGLNEVKIILTWGVNPRDEDSHLIGPGGYHTWYADKQHSVDGTIYADLDWDDVTSYGPETTTIRKLVDGQYRFFVHNYSGESPLRNSGATVKVYIGNSQVPSNVFSVPTGDGEERYWIVFDMNVSQSGANIVITEVGTMNDNLGAKYNLLFTINQSRDLLNEAVVGDQPGNFPQEAVDAFLAAILSAQAVYENPEANDLQMNEADRALEQAIYDFSNSQIQASLRDQLGWEIQDAQAMIAEAVVGNQPGNFPQEAVDAFSAAIVSAQTVYENTDADEVAIKHALSALQQAMYDFSNSQIGSLPDELGWTIEDAQAMVAGAVVGDQPGNYPQEAVDALSAAILSALTVYENPDADEVVITNAITALQQAMDDFWGSQIVESPRTELANLITYANNWIAEDSFYGFPQEALDALIIAVSGAQTIYDSESATLEQLEMAFSELSESLLNFEKVLLPDFLSTAQNIKANMNISDYPSEVVGNLDAAILEAQAESINENSTFESLDPVINNLKNSLMSWMIADAIINLKPLIDEGIAILASYEQENIEPDSFYYELSNAVNNAQTVYNDVNATYIQVDDARTLLVNAMIPDPIT